MSIPDWHRTDNPDWNPSNPDFTPFEEEEETEEVVDDEEWEDEPDFGFYIGN